MIAEKIELVTRRISSACEKSGRSAESVKLVCVTKTASVEEINEAIGAGARLLGENRVQDAVKKYASIGNKAEWHLIGHLQTNKARDAVRIFSLIHSVDSVRLAKEIDKEAARINKIQDILVQVNTSGEASKFGMEPGSLENFIKETVLCPNIKIKGLMTIAPEAGDPETVRPYFRALRQLRDKVNGSKPAVCNLQLLSMGMSGDFEVAIEEGSNMVRVGRAIFGR
ncbi:MAG: YggS family pyridoxal phosphate-dependent enzyme [Candidatus Omnitrophica bacterium]|nr:YggS family pyridoxal phosphate-dependent enzyme [Candidatus Omnitrophota bacterium]